MPGKSYAFNIDQKLSPGEINQSGITDVELTFEFDKKDYIRKEFTIPGSSIKTLNAPDNKSVSVETKQLRSVILIGPREEIEKLDDSKIVAVVDLSDFASVGSVTKSVTVYSSSPKVWCISKHEIQIDITDKSSDTSQSNN